MNGVFKRIFYVIAIHAICLTNSRELRAQEHYENLYSIKWMIINITNSMDSNKVRIVKIVLFFIRLIAFRFLKLPYFLMFSIPTFLLYNTKICVKAIHIFLQNHPA